MSALSIANFNDRQAAVAYILARVPDVMGQTQRVKLSDLGPPWQVTADELGRTDQAFFGAIGIRHVANREVGGSGWNQPILEERGGSGFAALFTYGQGRDQRFLVHICSEPGNASIPYACSDKADQAQRVADGYGLACVGPNDAHCILTTAALRGIQASMSNVQKHNGAVPLIGLVTRRLAAVESGEEDPRSRLWLVGQDAGRHLRKMDWYAAFDVTAEERDEIDRTLLAGPTAAGGRQQAWDHRDFLWVDWESYLALEKASRAYRRPDNQACPLWTNPFLATLAYRARRE